jgi:hypothetical protein
MIQNGSRKAKISKFLESDETNCHCRARRVDSDSIFFFENGHCMRKLSRSEIFPKQEKIKGQSQLVKGVQLTWKMMSVVHHDDVNITS